MANSFTDWMKRYGLWLLILLGVIVVISLKFIPAKVKPDIIGEAEKMAKDFKIKKQREHAQLSSFMDEKIQELMAIKAIKDEKERMGKLAEFSNRRPK